MQQRKPYLVNMAFRNYLGASVLTVAATQVANIVDAAIVGNMIGPEGLAAVNLCKPVLQAIFAISCLYAASASIMAGMAIGRGDRRGADALFSFSLMTSLALGALIVVGGLCAIDRLADMLCSSDALRPMTREFLAVTLLSAIPQTLMYSFHLFVTIDGSPNLVSRAVVVGNVANIALDIVLIKYAGMGIGGAAWATFCMYVVCVAMVLPHFQRRGTLRFQTSGLRGLDLKQVLTIGLPLFFSTVLLSVQYVGNNYVAGAYLGDGGLIALAVCMQLFSFSMIILTGTLRTIQPVGAILRGLEDHRGMWLLVRRAYMFMGAGLLVYMLAILIFPDQIAAFLGATDGATMPMVRRAMWAFTLHIAMQALLYNLMPVYQFYGHKNLALFLSVGQTLLPMLCFWGMRGHWMGFFTGQCVTGVVILISTALVRRKNKGLSAVFLIPATQDGAVYDSTIPTTIEALGTTRSELQDFLESIGLPPQVVHRAVLCTEELAKNIIDHGHAKYVDIRATDSIITLHDDGRPFNPLEYSGEGLGLKIVHGMDMDIKYDYRFNQNMITMKIG